MLELFTMSHIISVSMFVLFLIQRINTRNNEGEILDLYLD